MKEEIERTIRVLEGLPLWAGGRAGPVEWFEFGDEYEVTDRNGTTRTVREYALHVTCEWRIVGPEGIVVGHMDKYFPAGDPYNEPPDFDDDKPGANRCDERIDALFAARASSPLTVEATSADHTGGIRLTLSDGYTLEVFPNHTLKYEHWRLFSPYTDEPHFVVTGNGIEDG
ncbi:MAG: hypothetical protein ACJ78Q_21210 [Chloroflexia bacterium]